MKKVFNRYAVIFLALTAYLIIYRSLWKFGLTDFYAAAVGCLFVYLVLRMTRSELLLKRTEKKMTPIAFLTFLGIVFLGQELSQLVNFLAERGFNSAGLSMYTAPEAEQSRQLLGGDLLTSLTSLLWPFALGPIMEELLYRSYACRNFETDGGKVLAILLSSIAFSLGHGRFYLLVNTFVSALVYGYVLFEYGVKWTCIFHVINNLGIVGLDLALCAILGQKTGGAVNHVIGLLMAGFSIAVIISRRGSVAEYIHVNRAPEGETAKGFLNAGFLVLLAYSLYKCIAHIAPM